MIIGVIGLGLLGYEIARRLLQHGHQVVGADVRSECRQKFRDAGGETADTSVDVAKKAEAIVLSLPDSDAVERVFATLAGRMAGKLVIDTTTGDPDRTAGLAATLLEQGVRFVDATVAGSSAQAAEGEVVVLAGGSEVDVRMAEPILRCFAKQVMHMGPCGTGARAKLVVNLVLGLHRAVLAEALVFARNCGLEPARMLEVLKCTPAHSSVMEVKGSKMVHADFQPQARLRQHHKDVRLILDAAKRAKTVLPLTNIHDQLLNQAEAMGHGDLDNSAIYLVIEAVAKGKV